MGSTDGRREPPIDSAEALGARPIGRLLWHTCSQTTLSVGVYGIHALTNAFFVAWGVGEDALAAVNLVAPVLLLLGAVSTTVGVGGASLVSRSLGAGRPEDAARAAATSFLIFWTAAVLMTVVGLAAIEPILAMLGAAGPTLEYARPYAMIIIAGSLVSTGFSSIVRAEGRLFFSTLLWVSAVLVQIILDPIFIYGFHLGVAGAALGTVGGQAVSATLAIWFFFFQRERHYRVGIADFRPRLRTVGAVLVIGAPSFLAGFGATLLAVLVNTRLAAIGLAAGAVALAAYAVCARIQVFVVMPQIGIMQGLQPIVGYNAGRGFGDRVARARALALRTTVLYGSGAAVLAIIFAEPLVRLFVSSADTIAVATTALRIIAIGFAFSGVPLLVSGYFQSLGRAMPSYAISIGTLVLIKVPLVLVLGAWGADGIWISIALGEFLAAAASLGLVWAPALRAKRGASAERRSGTG